MLSDDLAMLVSPVRPERARLSPLVGREFPCPVEGGWGVSCGATKSWVVRVQCSVTARLVVAWIKTGVA